MERFGPEQPSSTLVLTFDNLGEASALERGEQPVAPGRDPSVTKALPWLLDQLDEHGLIATFFVEAINCELYPDAVQEIVAGGHEIGHHGWSHETWRDLSPEDERDVLCIHQASLVVVRGIRHVALSESVRDLALPLLDPSSTLSTEICAERSTVASRGTLGCWAEP